MSNVTASDSYEHGAYLREQTLNGTATDKDGKTIKAGFVWKNPNTQLSVSDNGKEYEYICIPYDTENYNRVEGTAQVTVNKLLYPPERPATFMNVPNSCDVVSKIALPTGWQWSERDKDIPLEEGENVDAVPVTAEYVGADKDNYKITAVTVSVKRHSWCEHTKTTGVVENLAPTCTKEGSGCISCAFGCGETIRNYIIIPKTAHNYQRREPDIENGESELFEYYKCSVCGKEYMTAAPPKAQEGSSEGSSESSGDSGSPDDTGTTAAVTPASQNQSREPFITSDTGAQGWAAIREYVQKAEEGSVITVSMNGESVVPADVMELIRGKAVMLVFDMGDGTAWVVSGLLMAAAAEGIPTVVYYEDELQGKLLFTMMTLTAEEAPVPVYYADFNKGTLTPADMAVMKTAAMHAHLYAYGKQCFAILYELGRSNAQTP